MEYDNLLSHLLRQDANREQISGQDEIQDTENMKKMPDRQHTRGAEAGELPCDAPIGMTYTPIQRKNSPRFTAGEALDRGTLWPGLELPFKNNYEVRNVANTPLGEVQALNFALVELALYLDTHPDDTDALRLFRQYSKAYEDKQAAYANRNGPLMKTQAGEGDRWNWIDNPWPWDYTEGR